MEEENMPTEEEQRCHSWPEMSPEIVEIREDSKSDIMSSTTRDGGGGGGAVVDDVYVAVGKDDCDVLKWALDHAVSPGACVFLVHVFPPITYIPTPVGKLSRSQLSQEQVRSYINEENNRRRNLLLKYIRLCADAKVTVDTMVLEGNTIAKAILDLIPVLNITNLVMGTKRPPSSRPSRKGLRKGEIVQKNAPEFCEVTIVYDGEKIMNHQQSSETVNTSALSSNHRRPEMTRQSERNFFDCMCFSGKFD